ncbi:MAG: competence/damage-inducible protein A [Bacteroidales bacterium]|nr:competence/damage-inducible protein A [Bacteroidales bacterium]
MKAEIITIGDELLIGQTIDTNSAWIGSELSNIGFDICRKTSVHDRSEDILSALKGIGRDTDLVIITGGLGPTSDDITKPVLCEFFNTRLKMNETVLENIRILMQRRGFDLNENNRLQALVPESCTILPNAVGTAPGMWFEKDGKIYMSLPGVPAEMKYLMTEHAIPELKRRYKSQVIIHKNIMTYGTYEAKLAEILTGFESALPDCIKLAYLPSFGVIKLRLTATGKDPSFLHAVLEEQTSKLRSIIPGFIFSEDEESLEMVIGRLLRERKSTVCTAESCTGGRIAGMITGIAGSSDYFTGSVIAYSNEVKKRLLGVKASTISEYGAVSEQCAREMAEGARKLLSTDFSVATTGIAGPSGGSHEKPVGTVWVAVASDSGTSAEKYIFGTDRLINIERFARAALNLLRKQILSY